MLVVVAMADFAVIYGKAWIGEGEKTEDKWESGE